MTTGKVGSLWLVRSRASTRAIHGRVVAQVRGRFVRMGTRANGRGRGGASRLLRGILGGRR